MTENKLTLDNESEIFFYEQEFYVFSNFSSFQIVHKSRIFQTAEHLYHWYGFYLSDHPEAKEISERIYRARSAHDAFKLAQLHKSKQVVSWDEIKQEIMYSILKLKVDQHDYVKQKLIESKGRVLIENSWRDSFWGWGPNRDGLNVLGKLWMKLRSEIIGTSNDSDLC